MLEIRAMSDTDPLLSAADALYMSAFPEIERIPLSSIHKGNGPTGRGLQCGAG